MADSAYSAAPPPVRFFSEQLMLELGQDLIEKGRVSRQHIEEMKERARLTGDPLDRLLIKESLVTEPVLLETLSDLTRIPFRSLTQYEINPHAVSKLPARAAFRYQVMPLDLRGGTLVVAVNRVPDMSVVDSLSLLVNGALEWVLCTQSEITKSLKHFYGLGVEAVDELLQTRKEEVIELEETDLAADKADPGVVKFVNQVIFEAITMDATDIHWEPFETHLRLRYRIDGVLQDIPVPKGIQKLRRAIASSIKIMAQLNIAERRKPHDGRIKAKVGHEEFDLRISVLPTRFGETVNMRILNRKTMFINMENLGLTADQLQMLQYLSDLPHGIVLITGPTGSGKTTTLYALLARINSHEVKIITVEDPVEYQMDGITQIQINPLIGLTFATILRSVLRHDPDIILVGEIRDSETADIAVRSSLTGHLVFSTLHTNDAPSAITRLVDMGIEPYLVSSCLEGVVAQRLVRRVCTSCREECVPDEVILEEVAAMFPERARGARFFKAHGCPDCNFTGYRGRLALFEVMMMDDALRSLVVHQRPANEIRHAAIQTGLVTLRQNGLARVLDGLTTVDEVVRVARRFTPAPRSPVAAKA
jgi:type II secretory ATPase GspE/PulE/Tfp pilus assembly ATPase PilB-like protein